MTAETAAPAKAPKKKSRKLLMLSLPLALLIGGGYFWLTGGRYEETDNANLRQARISVASEVAGRVTAVEISDNEHVRKGAVLFTVDAEPYRLALAQADAALAQARMGVAELKAAYAVAVAQEKATADTAAYEASELARQVALADKGVSSTSTLDEARHTASAADEALSTAHQNVQAALAALGGAPDIKSEDHPSVIAAQVARDQAAYDLGLTTVRAPADGVVYQAASFKPGQYVTVGTALFALVETGDAWVEANFKETQLEDLLPGQQAEVTFDVFPGRRFDAVIEAIGAGTGAEFSVLPAQNATGNWVKVTQRIPVRLRLDGAPEAMADLRSGMSATVTVDTHRQTKLAALISDVTEVAGK